MTTELPVFETERLLLRPYTMDDVESSYQVNRDPEVSRYTGDGGPKTREEMATILRDHVLADYQKHGYGRYLVFHKEAEQNIGFSGLKYLPEEDEVDIGYRFAKKFWGQGIATESCHPFLAYGFEVLQLPSIIGMVLPDNKGSIRVLEKLGFTFERDFMEDGEKVLTYRLLATDWRSGR